MSSADNVSEQASNDENEIEIKMEIPDTADSEYFIDNATRIQPRVVLHDPSLSIWTSEAESCLIKQYKKYKPMVGQTARFKSFRDMFDTISVEMQKNGFFFGSQKCENKWRVLERKYKTLAMREMLKKPGRMKHYGRWEHKKAFDEIYNEERKHVYLEKDLTNGKQSMDTSIPKVDNNTLFFPIGNGQIAASDIITSKVNVIISELRKISDNAEKNKEKRHLEKMAVLKRQLEVQERLLKIKEQKLELKRASIAITAKTFENFV